MVETVRRRIQLVAQLVTTGRSTTVLQAMRRRVHSDNIGIGLRRDLTVPHAVPPAKVALEVRPLQPTDDLSMLDLTRPGVLPEQIPGLLVQRHLVDAAIPTCWAAIAPDGKVCYMQWLIASRDNARVRAEWGGLFPRLQADEALLEGAYTDSAYRGQGIMAHAMARIAEQARELGARWVITFVGETNAASLKGCQKAGFAPYVRRIDSWRLLRRTVRFTPLTP